MDLEERTLMMRYTTYISLCPVLTLPRYSPFIAPSLGTKILDWAREAIGRTKSNPDEIKKYKNISSL